MLWVHIRVWRKLSVWTKDTYMRFLWVPAWTKDACMRLSIFPNTYAEVILLRLCEININVFLSTDSKQMHIMPRYNSCLPVSRTVASNSQEENVLFVWKIRECRKCDVGLCIDNCFEIFHTTEHTTELLICVIFIKFSFLVYCFLVYYPNSSLL